jgi:putative ABC transport system permease protein
VLAMLKNYLLVTLRNLRNNKLFSFINIAGLAIGLSSCFMIWQYVRMESSYDKFHENADQLYRVPISYFRNDEVNTSATNVPAIGNAMKTDLPGVKDYCRLIQTSLFTSDLGSYVANALEFSRQDAQGKFVSFNEQNVWFTDASILTMFTFPLISGTDQALSEPNSIVLTESMAKKYFGNEPALGQELRLNREMALKVTGVIQDVPVNSHLQFDLLISFSTMRSRLGDFHDNWGWAGFYNYVLLDKNADAKAVEGKLQDLKLKYIGPEENSNFKTRFTLQPIKEIHLNSGFESEQSPVGNQRTVYFLSILAVLILVIALINYINLSTAKALERSREVGLRKSVGAMRGQLIMQFLFDTAFINMLGLLFAIAIVAFSWGTFEQLIGKPVPNVLFSSGISTWLLVAGVFLMGVFIAGIYPALTLSSFQPVEVLKGKFSKTPSGSILRKLMVSFQYVLAVLLLAGTITIYLQLNHMRSLDPGFTKEQVVVVEAPAVYDSAAGERITFFRNGVLQISAVNNITATSDVPGKTIVERSGVGPANSTEEAEFFLTFIPGVDTLFHSTFDIKLLAGRIFEDGERMSFRRLKNQEESIPVIVNEEFTKRLKIKSPEDALKERMTFWWGPDQRFATIIGVVENHHQVSFKEEIVPVMYMQPEWHSAKYFAIKLNGDFKSSIADIQSIYASAFPGHPFSWFFLDQHFDDQYRDEDHFGKIFNTFTGLAIIVTCLGLFGLSIFSVSQRYREMGIRKVLGASGLTILLLFWRDFLRVLIGSYCLALPVIYFAGNNWLENFSFRIPLQWQIFVFPLLLLSAITLLTIFLVSARVAVEPPVKALRRQD